MKSFRGHLLQRAKPTATAALSSPEPCFDTTSFVQNLTREVKWGNRKVEEKDILLVGENRTKIDISANDAGAAEGKALQ